MDCERYIDLMFQKIDGDISEDDDKLLSEHLDKCESCRNEFSELMRVEHALNNIPEFDVPDTFAGAVISEIKKNPSGKKKRGYRPYFSLAAACIVLVVVLFYNAIDGTLFYDTNKLNQPNTVGEETNKTSDDLSDASEENKEISIDSQNEDGREPQLFGFTENTAPDENSGHDSTNTNEGYTGDGTENTDNFGVSEAEQGGMGSSQEDVKQDIGLYQYPTEDPYQTSDEDVEIRSGGGSSLYNDSSDASGSSDSSQSSAIPNVVMSVSPGDEILQNSNYIYIATLSITQDDLKNVLLGLTYTQKDNHVYEMDIHNYEILKERAAALGLSVDEEEQNTSSEKVLLIATVN